MHMTNARKHNKKKNLKKKTNKSTLEITKDNLSYPPKNCTNKTSVISPDPHVKNNMGTDDSTSPITLNQPSLSNTNAANLKLNGATLSSKPTTETGKSSSTAVSNNDNIIT